MLTRREGVLFGVLIGALLVLACDLASAQVPLYNIQRNGAPQFSASALQHDPTSTVYNFCDTPAQCGSTPPPPDPGAYTIAVVTWLQTPPIARSTDVTQFFNVFGRISPSNPVQPWPGVNGATVKLPDTSAKYYRLRLALPANPGTLSHFLKAVSYGASPGLRARYALVAAGAPWPSGADSPCYKTSQIFSDQTVLNINPGAPNTAKCSVVAGGSYDVLIDSVGNGTLALSWN